MSILDGQEEQEYLPPNLIAPTPAPPSEDFFRYRIESEQLLEEIEHKLKGEVAVPDGKGNIIYEQKYARWVNDEGISVILSIIYDYANKNTYLANLTKDSILYKCRDLKKKLSLLFFQKYEEYEIDKCKRTLVIQKIMDAIHISLSRCEDGKEAEQLSSATQRHEIFQRKQEEDTQRSINPLRRFRLFGGR